MKNGFTLHLGSQVDDDSWMAQTNRSGAIPFAKKEGVLLWVVEW